MTPLVSVVGPSGSGKTVLLEKIIRELKRRGWRVAVIKHSRCELELDTKGKDSWRHAQAGADAVIVSSPDQWAIFKNTRREWDLTALRSLLPEMDIILSEGYKKEAAPKLEIVPPGTEILSPPAELLAVVSDDKIDCAVPCFSRNSAKEIVAMLENRFLM